MISVLFLIPTLDRGGAENVLVDLVNHMDQSKVQITVQTLFDQNSQKSRLKKGIEYRTFLKHQFRGNSRLFARIPAGLLYWLIVRKRYDIVVSYLEGPTTHIIDGCPYDSKRVAWVHVEMNGKKQLSVGFRSLDAAIQAYQRCDRIVFVARSVLDSFENVAGRAFKNACVRYNTVDDKEIRRKASVADHENPFSGSEFNIVSVGRIIPAKGFDRLARIQKQLIEDGYNTHIYILGCGTEQEKIQSFVTENHLSESFTFLGFQSNPYPYIAAADLFVCSSRREGFSTAVSEALILGVPVVSTACSGAYELLGEYGEYGIVTDNNEEALLKGIKGLLEDSSLVEHYRVQARERGKSLDSAHTVNEVENLLMELNSDIDG